MEEHDEINLQISEGELDIGYDWEDQIPESLIKQYIEDENLFLSMQLPSNEYFS